MAVPFTTFTTRKRPVLTSKIDKLFIVIGIIIYIPIPLQGALSGLSSTTKTRHNMQAMAFPYQML
jgi:hypothetical protein